MPEQLLAASGIDQALFSRQCARCVVSHAHFALFFIYFHTGLTKAPLPATSHTSRRAHFQSFASTFHSNFAEPNSCVLSSTNVWRCVFVPSPQTTSANFRGNVQIISVRTTICSGDPCLMSVLASNTSPVETK